MRIVNFYPDDWLAGTIDLPPEVRGVYITLLALLYSRDGRLADEDARLARLCGCSTRRYRTLKVDLITAGKIEIRDGFIFNERAEKVLKKAAENSANQRDKAAKRWANNPANTLKNNNSPDAPADAPADAFLTLTSSSLRSEEESLKQADFEAWWSIYPRRVGKGQARKAFAAALKKASLSVLTEAARRFAEECAGKDPKFIPHPATWLNGERWSDEPARASTGQEGPAAAPRKIVGYAVGTPEHAEYLKKWGYDA